MVTGTVAASLAHHRKEAGMTCAGLARATRRVGREVDARYIALIEQHQRAASVDDLLVLSAALGITPAALLLHPDCAATDPVRVVDGAKPVEAAMVWAWLTAQRSAPFDGPALDLSALAGLSDAEIVDAVRAAEAAAGSPAPPWDR
ncbi:helix-turn-helix transcriptional regulator [Gordonia malaquae]|uniref:helix-turn-helix domain-containing protein n=1 Tax=Gordonia malaquae TaxID=410332 RepID=UPI0030FE318E